MILCFLVDVEGDDGSCWAVRPLELLGPQLASFCQRREFYLLERGFIVVKKWDVE